jgi:hypothetical protein
LQQSKDQDREMFEQQLQQLRTEYRETKDQLTAENMMLSMAFAFKEDATHRLEQKPPKSKIFRCKKSC